MLLALALMLCTVASSASGYATSVIPVHFPNMTFPLGMSRLCTAVRVDQPVNIVKIVNHLTDRPQYHMVLQECLQPGFTDDANANAVWDCEEFADARTQTDSHGLVRAPPCAGGNDVKHSFYVSIDPHDTYEYPGDAAFRLRSPSYLVIKAHLMDTTPDWHDQGFGLDVTVTRDPVPRVMDTFISSTIDGVIAANSTTHVDHLCPVTMNADARPFMLLLHGHSLTKCISMWHVDGRTGDWTLITRQAGSAYVTFAGDKSKTIRKGDMIAVRCTAVNPHPFAVGIG